MIKRFGMFAVTGMLALLVLAACGSEDDEAEPTVTRVPATNAPVVTATAAAGETQGANSGSPVAGTPVAGSPAASSPVATGPIASPPSSQSATAVVPGLSPVASAAAATATTIAVAPTSTTAPVSQTTSQIALLDIRYDPKTLTIPANTDVTIQLPNNGVTTHNFNIDSLNLHSGDIQPGQSGSVTINAAPGTYDYYCSIPGHKEAGMVGTITVQ